MSAPDDILNNLFRSYSEQEFNELVLKIFHYQYSSNPVYRKYTDLISVNPDSLKDPFLLPFMPITFFKEHRVISGNAGPFDAIFTSSGTTGSIPSRHFVKDLGIYRKSFNHSFEYFYREPEKFRFLVLLPGYLERQGSSLVNMMEELVSISKENHSGFYLHDFDALARELAKPLKQGITTILFGASYALLDFSESYDGAPLDAIVMETGGMKGRRKEMVRQELHKILCHNLGVDRIHSEYGMTELLSQAYSRGGGIFRTPPWMKVMIRDMDDPLEILPAGKTGGINIIDCANLYSCSFIATQDLGRVREDGSFEVLGRFDDSDVRGCNLMVV